MLKHVAHIATMGAVSGVPSIFLPLCLKEIEIEKRRKYAHINTKNKKYLIKISNPEHASGYGLDAEVSEFESR
jgi:hypothetical protein